VRDLKEFDSNHWRLKAEETRAMAANLTTHENRLAVMRIAETYDKLAEQMERRERARS
jgi:hypothetical protein